MNDALFAELLESVSEAGAYLRGEPTAARVTIVGEPEPLSIRERLRLTHEDLPQRSAPRSKALRN
jgi:hypothetical protein